MNLPLILDQIETAQLAHRADDAELAYLFKHALTQETAYAALLKKTRRDIHLQVAQAIETQYADRLDEYAALLAQHYADAGNNAQTLHYSIRAGDAASRIYASAEAITHYTRALDIARTGGNGEQTRSLYLRLGRELELSSRFTAALEHYEEMEHRASAGGDRALELAAITAQCQVRCTPNSEFDPSLGEPLAQQALRLAGELGDRASESKILWILVNLYRFTDRLPQALAAGERSLDIARELSLREQMAYTLNDLAHAYSFDGNFKQARASIQEATRLWRELDNMPMLADSLATASMDAVTVGEFDEAVAQSDEAYQISQTTGNLWGQTYSLSTIGGVYWMRGETARGIAVMKETLRLSERSGYPVPQLMTRADLGLALASLGAFEEGLMHAQRAFEFAKAHYAPLASFPSSAIIQIYLWMNKPAEALAAFERSNSDASPDNFFASTFKLQTGARLAFAQSNFASALDASLRLVERVKEFAMRTQLPEALYLKGLAERGLGQTQAARASLLEARQHAEGLQARWQLWQILSALGEIESVGGNRAGAKNLFGEVRVLIAFIADHSPSELRESLLNLPQVRKVENLYVEP